MLYMPKIFGWWLSILIASITVVSAACSGNYGNVNIAIRSAKLSDTMK